MLSRTVCDDDSKLSSSVFIYVLLLVLVQQYSIVRVTSYLWYVKETCTQSSNPRETIREKMQLVGVKLLASVIQQVLHHPRVTILLRRTRTGMEYLAHVTRVHSTLFMIQTDASQQNCGLSLDTHIHPYDSFHGAF